MSGGFEGRKVQPAAPPRRLKRSPLSTYAYRCMLGFPPNYPYFLSKPLRPQKDYSVIHAVCDYCACVRSCLPFQKLENLPAAMKRQVFLKGKKFPSVLSNRVKIAVFYTVFGLPYAGGALDRCAVALRGGVQPRRFTGLDDLIAATVCCASCKVMMSAKSDNLRSLSTK